MGKLNYWPGTGTIYVDDERGRRPERGLAAFQRLVEGMLDIRGRADPPAGARHEARHHQAARAGHAFAGAPHAADDVVVLAAGRKRRLRFERLAAAAREGDRLDLEVLVKATGPRLVRVSAAGAKRG